MEKIVLLYGLFGIVLAGIHINMKLYMNDDLTILEYISGFDNLFMATFERWRNWEGSWLCQLVMSFVIKYMQIFKVCNLFICISITYSIVKLLPGEQSVDRHLLVMLLFLLYPLGSMSTAGWVVTSVVYLWVVAATLYALTVTKKILCNEQIDKWEYVLSVICVLYGANREQSGLLILILLIGLILYVTMYCHKAAPSFLWLQLGVATFSWLSVMLAPGVAIKNAAYKVKVVPYIEMISFGEKLLRVSVDILNYFINEFHFIVLLLVVILFVLVVKKCDDWLSRGIGFFPLLYSLCAWIQPKGQLGKVFAPSQYLGWSNINDLSAYIPFMLQMLWVGCVLASLWLIFENSEQFWLTVLILISGIATKLGVVVSAAIVPSGTRTSIFFYFVLIYVVAFLFAWENNLFREKLFKGILGLCSIAAVLNLIQALIVYGGIIPHYIDRY